MVNRVFYTAMVIVSALCMVVLVSCGKDSPTGPKLNDENENSITFVTIPGGTFQMGDMEDVGQPNEKLVHTVTVSTFEMSAYEITNAQYAQYLNEALASGKIEITSGDVYGKTGSWSGLMYLNIGDGSDQYQCLVNYSSGVFSVTTEYENWPVVDVTWYGAKAFAEHYGIDLPCEAEWEYTSRWGSHQYMYGTDDGTLDSSKANYLGHLVGVGSYPANPFGVYNMSGNVNEWCADWYGDYTSESQINPTGAQTGTSRVVRSGSFAWFEGEDYCRSAHRFSKSPDNSFYCIGFRVVRRSTPINR